MEGRQNDRKTCFQRVETKKNQVNGNITTGEILLKRGNVEQTAEARFLITFLTILDNNLYDFSECCVLMWIVSSPPRQTHLHDFYIGKSLIICP